MRRSWLDWTSGRGRAFLAEGTARPRAVGQERAFAPSQNQTMVHVLSRVCERENGCKVYVYVHGVCVGGWGGTHMCKERREAASSGHFKLNTGGLI